MCEKFDFSNIHQYDDFVININKKDYKKMNDCIVQLKEKYDYRLNELYQIQKNNIITFDFENQRNFITIHNKLLIDIINEVLNIYNDELKNLSIVFLSGSFARGTNKMSSDVDLHFFYNIDDYDYIYEEIVSYIISRVINKSRDCIDPTFIFNLQSENKSLITSKMNKNKLNVILRSKSNEIKYSYKSGKKRRFYLQYVNTRDINVLFNYLNEQVLNHNHEWCHCFEIIKGNDIFNKMYNILCENELKLINNDYISNKIRNLIEHIKNNETNITINSIAQYKNIYQSKTFEWIYEYISILRLILINQNYQIKYLNLIDMYDILPNESIFNKNIFIQIYKYMWELEKLTVYCYENNINYGLHNNDLIDYSTKDLDRYLNELKNLIIKDLERLCDLYE